MYFLIYPQETKKYKLWAMGAKSYEICISRDLFFNENDMPDLKEASNESIEFAKDQDIQL